MINKTFHTKYCISFILAFIGFTAIGTITHEIGHYTVAKMLGYDSSFNYRAMKYDQTFYKSTKKYFYDNKSTILNEPNSIEKKNFEKNYRKSQKHKFLITLGGPFQTILTACIGLFIIYFRRKKRKLKTFNITDWVSVFLSLFVLREVFNLIMSIGKELIKPNGNYFGYNGDEVKLSYLLNLPAGTFPITLGIFGLLVSIYVIFKIIPIKFRLTFIISGFFGGILGFYIWMNLLGPILLP